MFKAWIKRAFKRQYHPLNRVEISESKLKSNFSYLSRVNRNIKVAPVLKSNAYGHGLEETASVLEHMKLPFMCVDSLYEAYRLLKAGIETKILVMGYVDPENLNLKRLPFSYAAYNLEHFLSLVKAQPHCGIHLFVDTGMNREGIPADELEAFLNALPKEHLSNIEGLMSHFAASDKPDDKRTILQVRSFKKAVDFLKKKNINPEWVHIANSSGLLNSGKLKLGKFTNMARCGITIYGIDPEGKNAHLKRVARLITHVVQVKTAKKGGYIGYDFTYEAKRDMKLAVLPIGYNDGVDRELSNKGNVYINKTACPIVGRVSMNLTVVDVTSSKNVQVGDEAEIEFVVPSKTKIPYEFLVHLNPQIKRVVV